jgi:hypothetical protein
MGNSWVAPWENARNKIHADKKSPPKNSLKAAPNHKTEVLECPFFQAVEATSLATSKAVSTLAGIKLKNVCLCHSNRLHPHPVGSNTAPCINVSMAFTKSYSSIELPSASSSVLALARCSW